MILRSLFAADVLVAEMDPHDADPTQLLAEEAKHLAKAAPKRIREFSAGRQLARSLLREVGIEGFALQPNPDRSPCWPPGVVGTITHTDSWAAVAVARSSAVVALGADVEREAPMKEGVIQRICVDDELAWLSRFDEATRQHWAKLIFSAKECAYKAQYTLSTTFLGFDAMRIRFDAAYGTFDAEFRVDAPPFAVGDVLRGSFAALRERGLVATGMTLRERPEVGRARSLEG